MSIERSDKPECCFCLAKHYGLCRRMLFIRRRYLNFFLPPLPSTLYYSISFPFHVRAKPYGLPVRKIMIKKRSFPERYLKKVGREVKLVFHSLGADNRNDASFIKGLQNAGQKETRKWARERKKKGNKFF